MGFAQVLRAVRVFRPLSIRKFRERPTLLTLRDPGHDQTWIPVAACRARPRIGAGGLAPRERHAWVSDSGGVTIMTLTGTVMVAATLVVIGVQSLLLAWLLGEHRKRRRAEESVRERLAEAQAQLVTITHLDRRAAIGEVSSAITHELNQPLEAILHNAEAGEMMLEAGTASLDELRRIFADIRRIDCAPPTSFSGCAPCCARKSSTASPSTSTRSRARRPRSWRRWLPRKTCGSSSI